MTSANAPSRLYIPQPFAQAATDHVDIGATSSADINFVDGFPSAYSASNPNGGKFVTRKEINALGYLASVNEYQRACGGVCTFDPALATKIGGYPKGAILEWIDGLDDYCRVISLVENNLVDFRSATDTTTYPTVTNGSIDGINWAYAVSKSDSIREPVVLADIDLGEIDAVTKMTSITMNAASFVTPRSGAVSVALTLGELVTGGEGSTFTYSATMYYRVPGWTPATPETETPNVILVGNDQTSSRAAEAVKLPMGTLCSIILSFGNIHYKSVKLKATIV